MNICVIPARSGSVRIPHKNRRLFHGRQVIVYSIETARETGLFDAIYISTDDPETIQIAKDYDCYVHLRSTAYLCGPEAGTQEVVQDCLLHSTSGEYKYACCIYATAPLMTAADIVSGYLELIRSPYRFVFVDGWYYWGRGEAFTMHPEITADDCKRLTLPRDWVDINTEEDWRLTENKYAALHNVETCDHEYAINYGPDPAALPEMIHFRCTKCGESLPT